MFPVPKVQRIEMACQFISEPDFGGFQLYRDRCVRCVTGVFDRVDHNESQMKMKLNTLKMIEFQNANLPIQAPLGCSTDVNL